MATPKSVIRLVASEFDSPKWIDWAEFALKRSSQTKFGGHGRLGVGIGIGTDLASRFVVESSIRRFYSQWPTYNQQLTDVVRAMSPEQLAIRQAPDLWPIWAIVGHTAGARVFWICGVCREPGADTTPFPDPLSGIGWEDDEETPRDGDELVWALDTTWALVDACLDRWTPSILDETVINTFGGGNRPHTRASIIQRMFSHDAYHCGELSQTLGIHGLRQIDLWAATQAGG